MFGKNSRTTNWNTMKKNLYLLLLMLLAVACQKNENLIVKEESNNIEELLDFEQRLKQPFGVPDFTQVLPGYLQSVGLHVQPVDNRKAALGRVLFYDKNLSRDGSVSCASCHHQDRAFSDGLELSTGIEGKRALRNSMALANVASVSAHYSPINGVTFPFLWDGRAMSIADLSRMAFANEHEMGLTMPQVVEQVKKQLYYAHLWKQLFGHFEVSEPDILSCISEFVGAIGSHDSKLDRALTTAKGDINIPIGVDMTVVIRSLYYGGNDTTLTVTITGLPGFSLSEHRGRDIFVANCTKCHSPIRPFQEVFAACNGLEMAYKDAGMAATTGRSEDMGVFKSPSLRNITLTAPYMHDGRFKTLEQVVEFYSNGVKPHANLHPLLRRPDGSTSLHLTVDQKKDLVAFLRTLSDPDIAQDKRFSNPFR